MPAAHKEEFGPWNPGLSSTIPKRLMPQVTLFDPRHSFVSWEEAQALSDGTGLKAQELAVTRPERLALHSVLIRVTSQLYVPDGPNYADLGISLRNMASEIYNGFSASEMDEIIAAYEAVRREAEQVVADLLEKEIYRPAPTVEPPQPNFFARLLGIKQSSQDHVQNCPSERARIIAVQWKGERNEDVTTASRRAIARVLAAALNKRGALHLDCKTIGAVSVGLVMNRIGSAAVGEAVEKPFARVVEKKGFRWLPPQAEPLVLNAKGASAAGKSTIRAAQREIAARLGYDWRDFAIISPDYWRKALIDYDGLGEEYKYAAMLTGYELEVIDGKLDILMAVKGGEGKVPHMLIDRFRFDSFHAGRVREEDSTLLTRFGSKVYLFFLVTSPADTVERAWNRGLETGRFKATDDLLYHNIEAYSGIPDLFIRWAKDSDKWVHYEFLDNSVERGERPRTIAYGQNGSLVVMDLEKFCHINRFQHVNVDAPSPREIEEVTLSDYESTAFLRRAMQELARVDVLVPGSNVVFARSVDGQIAINLSQIPKRIDCKIFGNFEETDTRFEDHSFEKCCDTIGMSHLK